MGWLAKPPAGCNQTEADATAKGKNALGGRLGRTAGSEGI
jgi:hypothetical protein